MPGTSPNQPLREAHPQRPIAHYQETNFMIEPELMDLLLLMAAALPGTLGLRLLESGWRTAVHTVLLDEEWLHDEAH